MNSEEQSKTNFIGNSFIGTFQLSQAIETAHTTMRAMEERPQLLIELEELLMFPWSIKNSLVLEFQS